jgi:restriction system protein
MPASAFEDLVLDVLHAMGDGDGSEDARLRTGGSGDRGIDGVIREDKLGLDVVYVQAKRWEANVGRPVVQGFVGALQGARASRGIIFTASAFSPDAREYAARSVLTL